MTEKVETLTTAPRQLSRWEMLRTSKSWQRGIRYTVSYIILILGAMFMLFPMIWMLSASLKPPWQIFTDPPIWIPQEWEQVQAGDTNRQLSLWRVEVEGEDEPRTVVQIGTRKYTTVINASQLRNLQSVPADSVGAAQTVTLESGVTLNVRDWMDDGGVLHQVVALARDGDNLVIATVEDLQGAVSRLPLDEVNSGSRAEAVVEGVEFRGREVTVEGEAGEAALAIIPIGPNLS